MAPMPAGGEGKGREEGEKGRELALGGRIRQRKSERGGRHTMVFLVLVIVQC